MISKYSFPIRNYCLVVGEGAHHFFPEEVNSCEGDHTEYDIDQHGEP